MAEKTLLLKTCLCKHKPMYSTVITMKLLVIVFQWKISFMLLIRRCIAALENSPVLVNCDLSHAVLWNTIQLS